MLTTILLFIKLFLFSISTKVHTNAWVVLAIDIILCGFCSFLFTRQKKVYKIISVVLYSIFSIILFCDVMYFSYFNRLPSVRELSHAGNLGDVTDALKLLIKPETILYIIDLPLIIYFLVKNKLQEFDQYISKKIGAEIFQFLPFLLIAIPTVFLFFNISSIEAASKLEFLTYHVQDVFSFKSESAEIEIDKLQEILDYTPEKNDFTGIAKDKNLIIIQVESLSNWVINKFYNNQEITPRLNELIDSKGTIYLDNYFEMLGAGNTSDAEFVSLHSLYPSMKNPSYEVYMETYLHGLPKILTENNYSNTAFHNYKRDFWVRDRAYKNIGFERFIAEDNFDASDVIGMGLSDKSFFKQSVPYLEEMKKPFFAFLVTLTSHIPYEMPESELKLDILPEDKGSIFGNYMNAIHYTDAAIGEFIDDLKEKGLYDDSVIVIYGDHHAINETVKEDTKRIETLTKKPFDYDTMLNIPLIIHIPGYEEKLKINDVASQIDLTPTVLNLLGIEKGNNLFFGYDILGSDHKSILYPQSYMLKGSYIDNNEIFTMSRDGVFEHGSLKDKFSYKKLDIENARLKSEEGIKLIDTCKSILENNLLEGILNGDTIEDIKEKVSSIKQSKIEDVLYVHTVFDIVKGYEHGYNIFKVDMHKTADDYFVSEENVGNMEFQRVKNGHISLGDLVGGRFPNEVKFIVKPDNVKLFTDTLKNLGGLHKNLIVEVSTKKEYEIVSNKSNGYSILLNAEKFSKEDVLSLSKTNSDLYFINSDIEDVKEKSFGLEGSSSIINIEDVKLEQKRKIKQNEDLGFLYLVIPKKQLNRDELKEESSDILVLPFQIDENTKALSYIYRDLLNAQTLKELMDENPKLKIAIQAKEFTVEILRDIANAHPDMDRLVAICYGVNQISFAKRLGYKNIVLDFDRGDVESQELRRLYGVYSPHYTFK